jgi:hypothetical protein
VPRVHVSQQFLDLALCPTFRLFEFLPPLLLRAPPSLLLFALQPSLTQVRCSKGEADDNTIELLLEFLMLRVLQLLAHTIADPLFDSEDQFAGRLQFLTPLATKHGRRQLDPRLAQALSKRELDLLPGDPFSS